MLSRKPHRKSRLGCRRCKLRRVKCDEVHPACGHCAKYGVFCDFTATNKQLPTANTSLLKPSSPVSNLPQSYAKAISSTHSTGPTQAVILPLLSDPLSYPSSLMCFPSERLLELCLFHHYINMASSSFIDRSVNGHQIIAQYAWSNWVVGLALSTPSLMDALLGLSAFHLRLSNLSDKTLSEASYKYMARAIVGHARQLREGANADNARELIATSTCIAFHAATSQWFLVDSDQKRVFLFLHWFHPWQGLKALLAASWQYIQGEEISNLIQCEKLVEHNFRNLKDPQLQRLQRFSFLLSDLRREDLDPETLDAYESSVSYLSEIHTNPVFETVLKFTVGVSHRFVELVSIQDPRTLTIVGYFFMLLKKLNGVWWLEGTADREFKILMGILPEEWRGKMNWAVREFEATKVSCVLRNSTVAST